tara:strand:- start:120205 stop:120711 length:507 start_codon:yes stop_codon:yes gene_type:complete
MSTSELAALQARCDRLEAIEAIRALKARYLNACDQQDPEAVRACFAAGEVIIDMSYFGRCENRDEFVDEIFIPRGCHDHVLDMHHGSNPEIEIIDESNARGVWSLDYRNINTQERTLTLLSALYHDEYRRVDGAWKISRSRTEYRTVLVCRYESGSLDLQVAGRSLAP